MKTGYGDSFPVTYAGQICITIVVIIVGMFYMAIPLTVSTVYHSTRMILLKSLAV
jgi:hypothetical protein